MSRTYEIPLDSRLSEWLAALDPPFEMKRSKLGGVPYYEARMTEIQALCRAAGVLPREFDAAVFSNADGNQWREEEEDEDCRRMFEPAAR